MKRKIRNTGKSGNRKNGLKIIAVAVLVLCSVIFFGSIELQEEKRALEKEKSEYETKLETAQDLSKELKNKRAYMQTVSYIEELAREVLGLVFPGETILKREEE